MHPKFIIGAKEGFDPSFLARVEEVLHGENLIQTILHAHLLVERALTLRLQDKLARPEVMDGGKYGRLSFHQKASLYVGLYSPGAESERLLFGLNGLRNKVAHGLDNEEECVFECFPRPRGAEPQPDAMTRVWTTAAILLFELGALRSIARADASEEALSE